MLAVQIAAIIHEQQSSLLSGWGGCKVSASQIE